MRQTQAFASLRHFVDDYLAASADSQSVIDGTPIEGGGAKRGFGKTRFFLEGRDEARNDFSIDESREPAAVNRWVQLSQGSQRLLTAGFPPRDVTAQMTERHGSDRHAGFREKARRLDTTGLLEPPV